MQKQYLTLLFNMRFIFGLIILGNIFLEARDYKILGNTSHRNTQTKKVIPSTSNQKVKCQKDRLFNIDIKGATSIATYISTITHQCNIVMKAEADVNKLMQTIPKSKSIKQENLIGIFDILLNPYGMRYELNKHVLKISAVKPPDAVRKNKAGGSKGLQSEELVAIDAFSKNQIERLSKLCNNNNMFGCYYLGLKYNAATKFSIAMELYTKACNAGVYGSCFFLGQLYYGGFGVKASYRKAYKLYKKACDGDNHGNACIKYNSMRPYFE